MPETVNTMLFSVVMELKKQVEHLSSNFQKLTQRVNDLETQNKNGRGNIKLGVPF
jgi:cell division protein FtsB